MSKTICERCGKRFIPNGCGPKGDWKSKIIKALPSSKKFRSACANHDWDYHYGGEEPDRKKADQVFYKGMKKIVKYDVVWWKRWLYYIHAYRNYLAVRLAGKDSFNYGGCINK